MSGKRRPNGTGDEFVAGIPPFRTSSDPKRDPARSLIKLLAQNIARELVEESQQKGEKSVKEMES